MTDLDARSAIEAAAKVLADHQWNAEFSWSPHAKHKYDSDCKVCEGDIVAMLSVVAPIFVAAGRKQAAADLRASAFKPTPAVSRTSASPVEFYEVDEPLADVRAAFDAGEKHTTRAPKESR